MKLGQQQVDTRSDIYSLGVTFWYLLTGANAICWPLD